jgi:hypothetical protein
MRHRIHISSLIYHKLREIAMGSFDTALGIIIRLAEVLVASAAGTTARVRAWATYSGHDQITRREAGGWRSYFNHFPQRFVTDHQVL